MQDFPRFTWRGFLNQSRERWHAFGASCLILMFAVGGLAPPKNCGWQLPAERSSILTEASHWPTLSTNHYVRVGEANRSEAVSMLKDEPFVLIDPGQAATFAPGFSPPPNPDLRTYLVRGVCYTSRPSYTILRFDEPTARLLVQQAQWNGEMLMPFRWVMEPNAFVVCLPRPPSAVYPDAVLGGDLIFRGKDFKTLDMR